MRSARLGALLLIGLALGACYGLPPIKTGTELEIETLEAASAEPAQLVRKEIDGGDKARAFYALEFYKTRSYAVQRLGSLPILDATTTVDRDLRSLFSSVYVDEHSPGSRGLVVVPDESAAAAAKQKDEKLRDELYWQDLRLQRARRKIDLLDVTQRYSYPIATIEQATRTMGESDAFLSYFVHEQRLWCFVLTAEELTIRELEISAAELQRESRALVELLQTPPDRRASGSDWRSHAERLYQGLLEPLEDLLSRKLATLYLSPDQAMANTPFDVLVDGDELLVERLHVLRVPSLSVLRKLIHRADRPLASPRMLVVGNPVFPEGVPALPAAEREAQVLARVFDDGALFLGTEATESAVTAEIPRANLLHFATHAVLLPSSRLDASSLLLTSDEQNDGFFSAGEIVSMALEHVELAVLSACQTSVSSESSGSLDLGSLSGAFLGAGVSNVIGTLWQVADASTSKLMVEMYRRLLFDGPSVALRKAKLALRNSKEYADPYYWSAFVLYGWGK